MRRRFKLLILLISFLISLLGVLTFLKPEQDNFNYIFSYLAYPVILINHQIINFCEQHALILSSEQLIMQNNELQSIIEHMQAQNLALQAQSHYWQEHQELIEFNKRYDFSNQVLAQVFLKQFSDQEHFFLLDKGALDNIAVDMVAIYKNCLVGKVVQVYPKYCKLILLTDRTCKIAVYDQDTQALGICCGCNNIKHILLSYVSHLQKINQDDLLISSGDGEVFPQGFGVGKIIDLQVAGMYYDAHASLLFDLQNMHSCYLVAANKA